MADSRINDDAQAAARQGVWVQASRDFRYDEELGLLKLGQVFQLAGHVNDAGLVRHAQAVILDPQPDKAALKALPTCGECGRSFALGWMRDRCGQSHEESLEQVMLDRRHQVHQRVERVMQVGA
ncbi:MAG: hypothetical protein GY700_04310 [Propionibacteriaceae bacterium]|nr:hypothetical protein [Propionibacteriaceae bacterium]